MILLDGKNLFSRSFANFISNDLFSRAFSGTLADIPKGSLLDHHHYASPMISPTAHFAPNTAVRGPVSVISLNKNRPPDFKFSNDHEIRVKDTLCIHA